MRRERLASTLTILLVAVMVVPWMSGIPVAHAASFSFSTGSPDGLVGTASRPPGVLEIETADDFILSFGTSIDHATFIGLLPSGAPLSSISEVIVEICRVFPADSANPPSGNVPTRTNSPSDVAFDSRDSAVVGDLSFTATVLNPSFTVINTVVSGIHPIPNQLTLGEGLATGEEVSIDVTLTKPFTLPADHYFFVPQVLLSSGSFLWLSAPKPIVGGTGPFTGDLQTWIRNANLDPDWLRVGTDIIGSGQFNAVFSLSGTTPPPIPEYPFGLPILAILMVIGYGLVRRRTRYDHA